MLLSRFFRLYIFRTAFSTAAFLATPIDVVNINIHDVYGHAFSTYLVPRFQRP